MRRHPTDLVSLVPGLLLAAIAGLALTDGLDIDLLTAEWAWPVLLIALGVVVLGSAGRGARAPVPPVESEADADRPTTEPADTPDDPSAPAPGGPDPQG